MKGDGQLSLMPPDHMMSLAIPSKLEPYRKQLWAGVAAASLLGVFWWAFRDGDEEEEERASEKGAEAGATSSLPQGFDQANNIKASESPVLREATTREQISKRIYLASEHFEPFIEEFSMDAVGVAREVCIDVQPSVSWMLPPSSVDSVPCAPLDEVPATPLSAMCSTVPSPCMSDSSWEDLGTFRVIGHPAPPPLKDIPEGSTVEDS